MSEAREHEPVMLERCGELVAWREGGRYLDATIGNGGHSKEFLRRAGEDALLVGLDLDVASLNRARSLLRSAPGRWFLVQASFARMDRTLRGVEGSFDGIFLDLGYSSAQLADARRGLSYGADGPLDMRLTPSIGPPASELIRSLEAGELEELIRTLGEERNARRIARAIDQARERDPIRTTGELASVISSVASSRFRIKTLSRVFQALRIRVNHELEALESALPAAVRLLAPDGRLGVISFHSLEDRIVKRFMVLSAKECICPPDFPECRCEHRASLRFVTRRAIQASGEEVKRNPRSRSARLRVAARLPDRRAA
ncbi:MAG: 16S rRNA (cytosine(1402)-N(4))-methyltransferase [Gemmatimonadetes bacterium]|nr:16S rRNA (cytosine(1402)-N(4))-methyltransferase [Gemmatimonadota bacterium]